MQTHGLQHVDQHTQLTGFVAHPSPDPVLTAFAQLGTLRLDAKRALISFFGQHEEHILAEATRTISLQNDTTDHNVGDEILLGACTVSYHRSFCKALWKSPNDQLLVVPDFLQEEEVEGLQISGFPDIRFLACSPIVSPKGIVIGAYTILDDKPHEPLAADLTRFLIDISKTVMDYLAVTRSRQQYLRSERMMVGLGSFLEGKGGLRNTWVNLNDDSPSEDQKDIFEGNSDESQQQMQFLDNDHQATTSNRCQRQMSVHRHNLNKFRNQDSPMNEEQQVLIEAGISARDFSKPSLRSTITASENKKSINQSPKESYTFQVKEAFSRSANIIRESLEVEAVVYFDANFGSQEAFLNTSKSDSEGSSVEIFSSSDDEFTDQNALPRSHLIRAEPAKDVGNAIVNPCRILGFSTSVGSSVNDYPVCDNKIALSETFLKHLLRHYPHGKIFNFGEDGSISSDETSGGTSRDLSQGSTRKKKTRQATLRQDAAALLHFAPNARSIIFSPLWDSNKERWYAGCLSWTRAPHRVLTPDDDLTFLSAFGNSLMVEIHRLGTLLADRSKMDLLSGMSHELRSPLHGIFGTVDILNDTDMDALQRGFMRTIISCASTLFGSITQLLQYAGINDVQQKPQLVKPQVPDGAGLEQGLQSVYVDEHSITRLDVVIEDAIESAFAGYSFADTFGSTPGSDCTFFNSPKGSVAIVLDIDNAESFKYSSPPGSWHVILANIFGNALKFTREGYIYVGVKTAPAGFDDHTGQITSSSVILTVRDTGCGMEQEFLNNKLSAPFSQEDNMTPGNGLGFNITKRTVSSLGGLIRVMSHKGVGTEVVTTVTLDHISEQYDGHTPDSESFFVTTKGLLYAKSIGISHSGSSDRDAALYSSLRKLCRDWFHMDTQVITPSESSIPRCDFYISLCESLDDVSSLVLPSLPSADKSLPPPVIIVCSTPRIAHSMSAVWQKMSADVFEFISQPCGPRKLAKVLETCLRRQQRRLDLVRDKGGIAEFRASATLPLTPNEFERDSFLQVQITSNEQSAARSHGWREQTELPESLHQNVENSRASGWKLDSAGKTVQHRQNFQNTVLLVDDNDINIRILVAYMRKLGYKYLVAPNGQEALDSFKKNHFEIAVILMGKSE